MGKFTTALDAADTYFLNEELIAKQDKTFEVLRSPLSSERLIGTYSNDAGGAKFHEYKMIDFTGEPEFVSSLGNAIPMANTTRASFTRVYDSILISMNLTIQDLRASNMELLPFALDKRKAAFEAIKRKQNEVAFFGKPELNIQGWFNIPNINKTAVATAWSAATPDEIIDQVSSAIVSVLESTDGALYSTNVVMPIAQYGLISTTARSAGSDTTILEFLQRTNPAVLFTYAAELKGSFQGGTDGFIVYDNRSDWFYNLVSIDFESHRIINVTNATQMSFESRVGGAVLVYPESQQFRYGI